MAFEQHDFIERALLIIQQTLGSLIISSNWDLEGGKLSFLLKNGIMIYIGYNSVGQYAYQVMKSLKQREFFRVTSILFLKNESSRNLEKKKAIKLMRCHI